DAGDPELIIYAPGEHPPRLAWKLTLSAGPAVRWLVVIDALSGAALTSFNEVPEVNAQASGIGLHGETLPLNVWSEGGAVYLVAPHKADVRPHPHPARLRHSARRHRHPRRADPAPDLQPGRRPDAVPDLHRRSHPVGPRRRRQRGLRAVGGVRLLQRTPRAELDRWRRRGRSPA